MAFVDAWTRSRANVFFWLPDTLQFALLQGKPVSGGAVIALLLIAVAFNGVAGPITEELYFRHDRSAYPIWASRRANRHVSGAGLDGDIHFVDGVVIVGRLVGTAIYRAEPRLHSNLAQTAGGVNSGGYVVWHVYDNVSRTAGCLDDVAARDVTTDLHTDIPPTGPCGRREVRSVVRQMQFHVASAGVC
jgi:hypothetical protein